MAHAQFLLWSILSAFHSSSSQDLLFFLSFLLSFFLVELVFELRASCLQSRCSTA
jgi:hypothetical protein